MLLIVVGCATTGDSESAKEGVTLEPKKSVNKDSLDFEIKKALSLGMEYYKNSQYSDAIPYFRKVVENLDPENELAWKYLADSYFRLNEPDSAFAVYGGAIAKFPKIAYLHRGKAVLYQKRAAESDTGKDKWLDSALAEYKIAYSLEPTKESFSATQIGRIFLSRAQLDSSIFWFEVSTRADSNDVDIWSRLVELYLVRNNWQGLRDAYRNLHRIDPENPEYTLNYARALANTGDSENAFTTLKKYIEMNPDDYRGYQYMALIQCAKCEYREAIKTFSEAEKRASDNVKLLLDIAETYILMKQYDNAERYMNRVRRYEPNNYQATIIEGDICFGRVKENVPAEGLGVCDKLKFECCYQIYKRVDRSDAEVWQLVAKSKLDYVKQYLPTDQEKKEFYFIHPELEGKICDTPCPRK